MQLVEELLSLIKEFKKDKRLSTFDEASTKQFVILRLLKELGWNPFDIDEIFPEYSVGTNRVDFSLRINGKNKVFIEVKKIGEPLEKHQDQLLNYSFKEGVRMAILTNGISWWFYLPLQERSWEQRKFYTIEIYDQDEEEIAKKFVDFLSKENVISGNAYKNAEEIYNSKQKHTTIIETLPKAWEKIISEPDEILVELLAETTEKICGHKPESKLVKEFLAGINQQPVERYKRERGYTEQLSPSQSFVNKDVPKPQVEGVFEPEKPADTFLATIADRSDFSGKRIIAFQFKGMKYPVKTWKEMLIKIAEILYTFHKGEFDKVFSLVGTHRVYFSRNPKGMREPRRISGSDIFIETNLSANFIVELTKRLISLFGYKEEDLVIETGNRVEIEKKSPSKPDWVIAENGYTGRKIVSFKFKGMKYPARNWRELLIKTAEIIYLAHKDEFEKALTIAGNKLMYFSKNPEKMRDPKRISNSDIYVETWLGANRIVLITKKLISLFGYKEDDLVIEME